MPPGTLSHDVILPARVLAEDDDLITVEVAKHDEVEFDIDPPEGVDAPPQVFYTLCFVKFEDGRPVFWKPWDNADS